MADSTHSISSAVSPPPAYCSHCHPPHSPGCQPTPSCPVRFTGPCRGWHADGSEPSAQTARLTTGSLSLRPWGVQASSYFIVAAARKGWCLKTPSVSGATSPKQRFPHVLIPRLAHPCWPRFPDGMTRTVTPGARLTACFQHPVHPYCVKTSRVVYSLS